MPFRVRGQSFYVGTPGFMSPEQLGNKQLTTASDAYSFGIFLWEIGTLLFPWQGKNHIGVRCL